ncbi:hypothetical protein LCGC14_1926670, partial [marine sediment metagenome]
MQIQDSIPLQNTSLPEKGHVMHVDPKRALAALVLILLAAPAQAAPAKTTQLDLGGGVKLELVLVPAGEFVMGSPEGEKERQACELPVHRVRITKGFYAGKFEVTNAQYRRFRPGHHSGDMDAPAQPALYVSWYDADAFCRWAAEKTGKAVRLPTEAQWEYACRAGTKTRFHTGDKISGHMRSADLPKAAWYGGNSSGRSQRVGQKASNAFGLYDMHGNAWEWCRDWFGGDYYRSSPADDPVGPATGKARILRGGGWFYWSVFYFRSAHRYRYRPDAREPITGFRVIVETGESAQQPAPEVTQPWPPPRQIVPPYAAANAKEAEVAGQFGSPALWVPRSAAPKIDGKLADGVWAKARPVAFRFLTGRAAPPEAPTVAKVLCDGSKVYFAFDCTEGDMARLTAAGKKRDDPVWQGDTVEVFLDPDHRQDPKGYYHIAVSPAGVTMDTRGGDAAWNPKIEVATTRSPGGWKVELALPLSELGLSSGKVPTVWGLNLTRYRPEIAAGKPKLGTLVPHSWPVDEPDKLRMSEDTGWSPTLSDSSHWPERFGHAVFEVGRKKTTPPAKLFELIAREDFASGKPGKFSKGKVVDGGYMGVGKALRLSADEGATLLQVPLTKFRDVQILATIKGVGGSGAYWHTFGSMYGSNKCCARQVTTLTRDHARLAPTFNYCDGAGRIDYTSKGMADPYYAGFVKHLSWFSEPTIGRIFFGGPKHWAVAYTRVGDLQTQHPHNKRIDPGRDRIGGWFFHPAGANAIMISDAVVFRGIDNVPPKRP